MPPGARASAASARLAAIVQRGCVARAAAAAALGALLALAQPPTALWPVLFVGWPLLFALQAAAAPRRAAALGWWAGFGHFLAAIHWVGEAFLVEASKVWWYAPVMPVAVALLAAVLAAFWAAAFWLSARLRAAGGLSGWRAVVLFACAFGLAETARGVVLTGFPWGLQAYVWVETPVLQVASLIGAQTLSALTVLAAALPAVTRPRALWPAVAALALVGGAWAWGGDRLANAPPPDLDAPVVRVVQPDVGQRDKWAPEKRLPIFERLIALTAAPPGDGAGAEPTVVIWPEVAVTFLFDESPEAIARSIAAAGGASIAVGAVRREGERLYNSLLAYGPDRAALWVYDKRHLTPFGEYVPYAWILGALGIGTLGDGLSGFSPGDASGPFALPGLPPVAPLICYEAVFPAEARAAAQGARWLIHVTNDSWFGDSAGPWQHLAKARARAIELGLPVARAANTGVSAMIDARGRVLERLVIGEMGVIDSHLPPAEASPTLYARVGDAPFLALLAIAAGLVLLRRDEAKS